ncbi:DNA-binding CsgD family transcriptional regulator [Kitasatospora sp. MAA4]|uniref:helix-turn-helix transcriptional regulator n=1 Tax=Kitasatospora sp. MAA4 TaxID=3035093 RepID=UPI002473456C|nr:LuxR family transcriptional regulator [Kitasatospora sp. MAA4]MDH6134247.1 DNA-binding CsgD family transcriptional regulator [Kitasatospora sp. MAA4]
MTIASQLKPVAREDFIAGSVHSSPLYERDSQLWALKQLFGEVVGGRSRFAVVSGAVGTGKSELLSTFADQAIGAGAVSLCATASRAEQAVPYGVLAQLFRTAGLSPERNSEAWRLLHHGVTDPLTSTAGRQRSAQVFHGLCVALSDVIDRIPAPVLIGVDDAHYADTPSLQCLSNVVRRLRTSPVLLICNESGPVESADLLLRAEFPLEPQGRRLTLDLLSPRGVEALLAGHLGAATARLLAAECSAVSGGNPLLVRGIIEDNRVARTAASSALVVDAGFDQAVLGCLYRCGSSVLLVARQLALLDEPVGVEQLARFVGLDTEVVARALGALESTGLLAAGRFRHPRARLAVLGSMDAEERIQAHNRTARLLYEGGAPALVVARQLQAAGRFVSDCFVPVLHEAAEQAVAEGKVDQALEILLLAYRFAGDERLKAASVALLARIEWRTDPHTAHRRTPYLTAAAGAGLLSVEAALDCVSPLLWFGQVDSAQGILRQVADSAAAQNPEAAARAHGLWTWLGSLYPAVAELTGPPRLPGAPDPVPSVRVCRQTEAAGLLATLLSDGPTSDSAAEAEHILLSYLLDERSLPVLTSALIALVIGDQLAAAERWVDSLEQRSRALSAPVWCGLLSVVRAEIALRRGCPGEADSAARAALALVPGKSWGLALGVPLSILIRANTAMGRYDEAVRHLQTPVPGALFQTPLGMYYLQARGRYHLATGRPQAALQDFLTVGDRLRRWRQDSPALMPWRSDAAWALLREGNTVRARELAEEQLTLCGPDQARARAASLRVLAACGERAARPEVLEQALEELQRIDARLEQAHVLNDLGVARQELGQLVKGRLLMHRAQQLAEECGAALPAPAAAATSAAVSGRPAATLSDAELRVATLAADGHSNRQIANKLFVTVSTVEQHLTKVYRKLNVTRRTDIARELHAA